MFSKPIVQFVSLPMLGQPIRHLSVVFAGVLFIDEASKAYIVRPPRRSVAYSHRLLPLLYAVIAPSTP